MSSAKLSAGIFRTDLKMADGRNIRYYDVGEVNRSAVDRREPTARPNIGELRLDLLTDEWVIVAPDRQSRAFLPPKDLCPLCPSSVDSLTEIADSNYQVVVFENKSPSLATPTSQFHLPENEGRATKVAQSAGQCEVVCFTDQHDGSFGTLPLSQMRIVMEAWRDRVKELSKLSFVEQIFLFENRGEEVGVTLNHPHSQIYAYSFLPPRTEKMLKVATEYLKKYGTPLLTDIIARELKDEVRIVATNSHWIAYVPFASRYPFEIHIAPRKFVSDLAHISDDVADSFAEIAKEIFMRLDGVFGIEMAYIASWHQAPVRVGRDALGLHLQITSVRRAPGKLKYLSGSESAMGAFVMDLRPEQSAEQLRNVKL